MAVGERMSEEEALAEMPAECCYRCNFWVANQADVDVVYANTAWAGRCHRYAPKREAGRWPFAMATEWCGEFKQRVGDVKTGGS